MTDNPTAEPTKADIQGLLEKLKPQAPVPPTPAEIERAKRFKKWEEAVAKLADTFVELGALDTDGLDIAGQAAEALRETSRLGTNTIAFIPDKKLAPSVPAPKAPRKPRTPRASVPAPELASDEAAPIERTDAEVLATIMSSIDAPTGEPEPEQMLTLHGPLGYQKAKRIIDGGRLHLYSAEEQAKILSVGTEPPEPSGGFTGAVAGESRPSNIGEVHKGERILALGSPDGVEPAIVGGFFSEDPGPRGAVDPNAEDVGF